MTRRHAEISSQNYAAIQFQKLLNSIWNEISQVLGHFHMRKIYTATFHVNGFYTSVTFYHQKSGIACELKLTGGCISHTWSSTYCKFDPPLSPTSAILVTTFSTNPSVTYDHMLKFIFWRWKLELKAWSNVGIINFQHLNKIWRRKNLRGLIKNLVRWQTLNSQLTNCWDSLRDVLEDVEKST